MIGSAHMQPTIQAVVGVFLPMKDKAENHAIPIPEKAASIPTPVLKAHRHLLQREISAPESNNHTTITAADFNTHNVTLSQGLYNLDSAITITWRIVVKGIDNPTLFCPTCKNTQSFFNITAGGHLTLESLTMEGVRLN